MKQFDDILKKKITDAFSSYDAGHLADKGWQSFTAARRGKRRLNGIIPLWAKAASVALIVSTGAFIAHQALRFNPETEESLAVKETIMEKSDVISGNSTNTNLASAGLLPETSPPETETAGGFKGSQPVDSERGKESIGADLSIGLPAEEKRREAPDLKIPTAQLGFFNAGRSLNYRPDASLKGYHEWQPPEPDVAEQAGKMKKTAVMAGLSGSVSRAGEGGAGAPGVSVGLYVDRRITGRISFRPGIALAMNTVGLYNTTANGAEKIEYAVPLYDGNSGTLDYYEGELNMLAIEIPLNFVFRIMERKRTGLYLSAGASTMLYLNQQLEADFINEFTQKEFNSATGQITSQTRYSTVSVSNDYGVLSRTDLMGLANISAGYSLPYGKTGKLLIEPFLQLPLADLTSLNLRVRYGGVSMKLRFGDKSEPLK